LKLKSLHIKGFRRVEDAVVKFGDTTFVIGANNVGKSTILKAIEILLSAKDKLDDIEYHAFCPDGCSESECNCEEIVLEAEFVDVSKEANNWRGFKGRVIPYEENADGEVSEGYKINYKKVYPKGGKCQPSMLCMEKNLKPKYAACVTARDLVSAGFDEKSLTEDFPNLDDKITTKAGKGKLELINDLWDVDNSKQDWDNNPGGIAQNVISRLPDFVFIPADDGSGELSNKSGALISILKSLFNDVREKSVHYQKAQSHLSLLANEMNPSDEESDFGAMMADLNSVLRDIFPESSLHIDAALDGPEALNPDFNIKMASNIKTPIPYQGTGLVRSAVFALLRFRNKWLKDRGESKGSGLIIGFEEPELYLHPNAANQMRDTIYELSEGYSQIVCTTHSPYMIDISRKPRQILNCSCFDGDSIKITPFNVSDAFIKLHKDDKPYVKMLLKIDDYVSRIFFAEVVVLVEGDTEDIVLRETIKRLPLEIRKKVCSGVQIVKARGKGALIPLITYLNLLGISYVAVHDRDGGKKGAKRMNEPISNSIGDTGKLVFFCECLEEELGYVEPSYDKPFKAYKLVSEWGDSWEDVPLTWRVIVEKIFSHYF